MQLWTHEYHCVWMALVSLASYFTGARHAFIVLYTEQEIHTSDTCMEEKVRREKISSLKMSSIIHYYLLKSWLCYTKTQWEIFASEYLPIAFGGTT